MHLLSYLTKSHAPENDRMLGDLGMKSWRCVVQYAGHGAHALRALVVARLAGVIQLSGWGRISRLVFFKTCPPRLCERILPVRRTVAGTFDRPILKV